MQGRYSCQLNHILIHSSIFICFTIFLYFYSSHANQSSHYRFCLQLFLCLHAWMEVRGQLVGFDSFHIVGSGDQTQIIRLGNKCHLSLPAEPTHSTLVLIFKTGCIYLVQAGLELSDSPFHSPHLELQMWAITSSCLLFSVCFCFSLQGFSV